MFACTHKCVLKCVCVCVYLCVCVCIIKLRCLRDILGVSHWSMLRNTVVLERTGELPVENQLRYRHLQCLGHLWRMPDHRIQTQLMRCWPSGRRRPPEGAPLRWSDLVNRDLSGLSEWQELIEDCPDLCTATRPPNLPLRQ